MALLQLDEIEARVLGSLVEKSLTTPDLYPLTYNSLLAACNQKTSREPVMSLTEETAGPAVHSLIEKKLVYRVHEPGSRVPKFGQTIENLVASSDPKVIGVVCVLLLRGPQTPGELKSRTERLCRFESTAEVESLLQDLAARPEPLVAKLPRQAGQKESRYRHLFSAASGSDIPSHGPSAAASGDALAPGAGAPKPAAAPAPDRVAALEKRVAELETRLAALETKGAAV
jgi:uncharacterized protein YceH (UPF0502 family)